MTTRADEVLDEVILQAASRILRVREAVWRCRTDSDPGRDLARECGLLQADFYHLSRRAWDVGTPWARHVTTLLNYHMELVAQASMLAFRPHSDHWRTLAERFGDDDGAPTAELIELADRAFFGEWG